jgi:hypothetical protein
MMGGPILPGGDDDEEEEFPWEEFMRTIQIAEECASRIVDPRYAAIAWAQIATAWGTLT